MRAKTLSVLAFAGVIAPVISAAAQTQAEIEASARDAYEMANTLSACAGFWDWWSEVEGALGNTATAQNAHNVSNGARLSAGYMLSMRHQLLEPDAPPRRYGSWDGFIEGLAEVTATRMSAALEQSDSASIEEQALTCRGAAEASQAIVDQIRAESLGNR